MNTNTKKLKPKVKNFYLRLPVPTDKVVEMMAENSHSSKNSFILNAIDFYIMRIKANQPS
jgi:hypothetical protein